MKRGEQGLYFLFFIGLIVVGIAEGIEVMVKKEWRKMGLWHKVLVIRVDCTPVRDKKVA